MKALQKDPGDRFQSATEMIEALRSLGDFENRGKRLSHYASGIIKKSFAGGDLGRISEDHGRPGVASSLLSEYVVAASPGARSRTTASIRGRLGVALGIVVLIGIGVGAWVLFGTEDQRIAPAVTSPIAAPPVSTPADRPRGPEKKTDGVLITVEGVPKGAAIYYRDAPVPANPFRVERRETIAPLRVELNGFEPFVTSLIPSEDQVVAVELEPLGAKKTEPDSPINARRTKKKPRPAAISPPDPNGREGKKLGKSGRGAKYSEEFE
jgi:hypothetical protein